MNDPKKNGVNRNRAENSLQDAPEDFSQNELFSALGSEICSAEFAEGCIINDEDV